MWGEQALAAGRRLLQQTARVGWALGLWAARKTRVARVAVLLLLLPQQGLVQKLSRWDAGGSQRPCVVLVGMAGTAGTPARGQGPCCEPLWVQVPGLGLAAESQGSLGRCRQQQLERLSRGV